MRELEEKLSHTSAEILKTARNELYFRMRFLDVALSSFIYVLDEGIQTIGTDGFCMYYRPEHLGGLYRKNRVWVNRAYLHIVLHCIFRHLIRRNNREDRLWNLACDIVIESMIDSMNHRSVRMPRSYIRQQTYEKLKAKMDVMTAERVYSAVESWNLNGEQLFRLEEAFLVDEHCYWPQSEEKEKQNEIENRWNNMSEQAQTDMETFSNEASSDSGTLLKHMQVKNRERFNYREFLRRFSVYREEISVDEDTFDYIFYSYGLELYGNMPLIEPLEVKEVKKVEEFVIVVDTSMSCSGELVKKFLEQTYSVLKENDSFFKNVHIRIIQCDDQVRADKKIVSEEELKEYMEDLELSGEGGTDFRPAFLYVQQLINRKEFRNLKGLIYFTDGMGVYPSRKQPYEVAFVFLEEDYEDVQVPPWAMKLIVDEQDLTLDTDEGEAGWI